MIIIMLMNLLQETAFLMGTINLTSATKLRPDK